VENEFVRSKPNIPGNLPQQWWGNVSSFVHWHGCATTIGMAVLRMGTTLTH